MPATKPKTQDKAEPKPSGPAAMDVPMAVGAVAVQAWMDMGTEAVRFVWDRLQQDMQTQQAMLACKSLEDLRRIQAEFFTNAQKEYTAEAGKMLDLMGKATASGLTASAKGRGYDDVPL